MRSGIDWVKANIVIVISAIVCVISLGFLSWVHARGNAFKAQLAERQTEIRKIDALMSTPVRIPPLVPDGPVREEAITVNKPAIDALKSVYARMNDEYTNIFKFAVGVNSQSQQPMIENLFPDIASSGSRPLEARPRYRASFDEMLGEYSPTAGYPQLNAKPPLSPEAITAEMVRTEDEYRTANFLPARGTLPPERMEQLRQIKTKRQVEMLRNHAERLHVYAQTNSRELDFPFDVGKWAGEIDRPTPETLWEGQMGLWIQQDLARVIALTNRVGKPGSNVMNAPVKRLIQVQVVPGYVGIDGHRGGMAMDGPLPPGTSYPAAMESRPALPAPAPRGKAGAAAAKPAAKLSDDFSVSPTGRRSNNLYDVRHVWLTIVIDSQRMPEFFDNLSQTNFMSVLKVQMSDVDEYKALEEGYVYGAGDAVQVTMLIETIWLRDWTSRLMPEQVRTALGVEAPVAAAAAPAKP